MNTLPAFPVSENTDGTHNSFGLTKREFIAAMVLQGLLANEFTAKPSVFVRASIKYSDMLLAELDKSIEDVQV